MSEDAEVPTGKPKRSKRSKREPIDPAKLPPSTVFENWWEDPHCKALCELVAKAIMREAAKDAPLILETTELAPPPAPQPTERRARRTWRGMSEG